MIASQKDNLSLVRKTPTLLCRPRDLFLETDLAQLSPIQAISNRRPLSHHQLHSVLSHRDRISASVRVTPRTPVRMLPHHSEPLLNEGGSTRVHVHRIGAVSTNSLPLRHSSRPRAQIYINPSAPLSDCQVESLPKTRGYQEDLKNQQYYLLYDLIGSRFYASCPELVTVDDEDKDKLKDCSRSSTFYQAKSRSSYRVTPGKPTRTPKSFFKLGKTFAACLFPCLSCSVTEERGRCHASDS